MIQRGIDKFHTSTFKPVSVAMIGLTLLDLLVVAALWFVLGWTDYDRGMGPFLTAAISHWAWSESLFDLVCLAALRFLALSVVYWQVKTSVSLFVKGFIVVFPILCVAYTCAKAVFVAGSIHKAVESEGAVIAVLVVSLVFCILETVIGILTVRRESAAGIAEDVPAARYGLLINEDPVIGGSMGVEDDEEDDLVIFDREAAAKAKAKGEELPKKPRSHATLKRVMQLAIPELPLLLFGSFALLLSSAANLAMPAFLGRIVSAVSVTHDKDELRQSIMALLVIFGIGSVFTFFRGWMFTLAGERLVARLRKMVFYTITLQEIAFFDANRTGELTNRLASDTAVLQNAATVNISMFLRYIVQALGAFVILFLISWKLTLVMLSVVPVVMVGAVIYGKYLKKLRKEFQDELAKSNATAEEALSNMRTVRTFAHENETQDAYAEGVNASLDIGKKIALAYGTFGGIIGLVAQYAIVLVLWYGGTLVLKEEMTSGTLISFMLYTLTVAMAFAFISSLLGEFMQAVGASERIFELMDRYPKIPIEGGDVPENVEGNVELENVSFTYPTRKDQQVLKGINLSLQPGKVVALVGRSGSGKSTIVSLIERFYDPQEGRILLDGVDIRTLDPMLYRRLIGYVKQEPTLFACSIKENIIFGCPEPLSQAQIEAAARMANAHDFIMDFPEGYDTEVGERGVRLSGGQKQRIAIARCIVLEPKILLLDEATSALDAESEHLVHEAIDRVMAGKSTVIVAHRLSTVRNATEVCVVQDGEIVERGTHDELLERGGIYKDLVKRQLQGGGGESFTFAEEEEVDDGEGKGYDKGEAVEEGHCRRSKKATRPPC